MVNFLSPTFTVLPKAARRQQPGSGLAPEEKSGLLKSIGSGALSGLAAAGNLIDVPWSMGRDILAGENPFDQLLTPFSPENRVHGRELLERGGILGQNKPGFDWGDVAGLAVDVADPFLLPLSFAGRALTKAGQVAKGAGLLESAAKVATDTLGKKLGKVGWREAHQLLKPKDLIGAIKDPAKSAEAAARFETAAMAVGKSGAELLDKPLGGLVGFGVPFKAPSVVIGKAGGTAQAIARGLDQTGAAIRFGKYSPIRPIANLFSRAGWSARSVEGFEAINRAFRSDEAAIAAAKGFGNRMDDLTAKAGLNNKAGGDRVWQLLEGVEQPANDAERAMFDFYRPMADQAPINNRTWGLKHAVLDDPAGIQYAHRQMTKQQMVPGGRKLFGVKGSEDLARKEWAKGWTGGTGDIRKAARIAEPIVREGGSAKTIEAALAKAIAEGEIRPILDIAVEGAEAVPRLPKVAKAMNEMDPDILATGIFGNYPVFDAEKWATSQYMKRGHAQAVMETLAGRGRGGTPILKAADDIARDQSVKLEKLVEQLDLHHGHMLPEGQLSESAFYDQVGKALGMQLDANGLLDKTAIDGLKAMRVEKTLAKDLGRLMEGWGKTPSAMEEPLAWYDSLQNVWKALQTGPWPAFQFRNRLSGGIQEALRGAYSSKWGSAVKALVKGQNSAVFKEHPLVRKLATEWGMDAARLTDQQASDLARALLRQHNVVTPYQGEALQRVGQLGETVGTAPEDFARQFLGGGMRGQYEGVTAGRIASAYAGQAPGTTIFRKPRIRGVAGSVESTFGPVKGGELLGSRVEAMNRAPGWFKETAKGVDPLEAAQRVGKAQVRYENRYYTPAEQAMLRVFPFGKFLRGQTEYVGRELLQRPAGPMGTLIRGTTRARGEGITPEYVQQTAAVPIPEGTPGIGPQKGGDLRYLAGFGLMHEDPLQLLGGGVSGGIAELLSRSSPAIKGPVEWATGRSFFQRGPEGGRELTEMDPTLGRIGRNVQQLISGERGRTEAYKLPLWVEQLSANLPTSRLTTTARTLTDPRKTITSDVPIPGPAAAMNVLTGARVVDVPEAAQEAILREAVTRRLRKTGVAKVFERTYVPKETLEQIPPDVRKDAEQMQALLNLLAERAQKRARGETLEPIGGGLSTTRTW